MIRYLIILLFISYNFYSQDNDYINSNDTLYILLPSTSTIILKNLKYSCSDNGFVKDYNFTNSSGKYVDIRTSVNDGYAKFNKTVKTKKFLRKNRKLIIDLEFIDRNGLAKTFFEIMGLHNSKKIIYIIDTQEARNKTMVIKMSSVNYSSFIEM